MKTDKRNHITTKLAYIAGFVDGEGCIRIKRSYPAGNSYYVTFHVTNSDKAPLELIKSIFGGSVFFQEKAKRKIIWQYYLTCNDAADALRTLSGYLMGKKDQANYAIWFHDNKSTLTNEEKKMAHDKMRDMKNPELLNQK